MEGGYHVIPYKAVRPRVVYGLHDGFVEHVSVEVNPETLRTVFAGQERHRLASRRSGAELADPITVNDQHARWQRLAAAAFTVGGVAAGKHGHVIIADQRPSSLDVAYDVRAAAGRGRAPRGIRLRGRGWLDLYACLPRLADGRRSGLSAATAANTAAMTADNACHGWTALEHRPSPQTATNGLGRLAHSYGSDVPRSKRVPVACPIGRSTRGTYGHSRTARYTGSPADGQADPLRKQAF